ncbi:MAG: amidohydrolase family protein [Chloroflexi bacterium]|nr:amidohydrolase family protein [Chloroflexota bacterium]
MNDWGPVFDVHLHASRPERFARAAGAGFGAHRRTAGTNQTDPEQLLANTVACMDQAGVRRGLLSGEQQLVQAWVQAYPERFLPSFVPGESADGHSAMAARFEEEAQSGRWRAMGELGIPYAGQPLNTHTLFPYYAVCERLRLPVFFHCGLDGPDPQRLVAPEFRVELGDPLLLQDVLIHFPDLRVVIMHLGWPFFDHALYMLYAYPNVYVDTGVVNWILGRALFERMMREALETVGCDRILFGSDQMVWPQMIGPAVEAIVRLPFLSDTDRRRILWANAAELLA